MCTKMLGWRRESKGEGGRGRQLTCPAIARWMRLSEGMAAITDRTSARVAGGGGGGCCGGGDVEVVGRCPVLRRRRHFRHLG